jgi:methylase of polypeptide subunit release factors
VIFQGYELRFHHWELVFPEIFFKANGFDLVIGNPPWVLPEFNEN